MLGHQLLVGGHHALSRRQRPAGEVQGHGGPADGLHHDIHGGIVFNDGKVVDHLVPKGAVREVPHIQDVLEPDRRLHLLVDVVGVLGQYFGHAGAHGAKAQDCNIHHVIYSPLIQFRRSRRAVSPRQDLTLQDALQVCGPGQELLHRDLEPGGLGADGHQGTAAGGDALVDGENIRPRYGKTIEH